MSTTIKYKNKNIKEVLEGSKVVLDTKNKFLDDCITIENNTRLEEKTVTSNGTIFPTSDEYLINKVVIAIPVYDGSVS